MTSPERWLREHAGSAPEALMDVMVAAIDPAHPIPIADALAAAAIRLYQQVAAGSGGRSDALPLLAADALFTQAFQARAETDPTALAHFAERWGGHGRLGEVADAIND